MNAVTFQAEVRRIEKLLYHIAWTHLGNDQDAEDAVQEALIKAWMKRDSLRDEKQFKPWLARILSNQCKDMLRKRKKCNETIFTDHHHTDVHIDASFRAW